MGPVENTRTVEDFFVEAVKSEFGAKLRRLRRARELSQDDLGKKVGLSRVSIATIEGGKQNTQLQHVYLLARALDASVEELLPTRDEIAQRMRMANLPEADRGRILRDRILKDARELLKLRRDAYEQEANTIPDAP